MSDYDDDDQEEIPISPDEEIVIDIILQTPSATEASQHAA
jgi:hypothetical protein